MSKDNGGPARDRELLEMAAKAAGIDLRWKLGVHQITLPPALPYYLVGGLDQYWNPLADDGDALRLAVKLKIDFYVGEDDGEAIYAGYFTRGSTSQRFAIERNCSDSATRRAIVRAAAAIGSAM